MLEYCFVSWGIYLHILKFNVGIKLFNVSLMVMKMLMKSPYLQIILFTFLFMQVLPQIFFFLISSLLYFPKTFFAHSNWTDVNWIFLNWNMNLRIYIWTWLREKACPKSHCSDIIQLSYQWRLIHRTTHNHSTKQWD